MESSQKIIVCQTPDDDVLVEEVNTVDGSAHEDAFVDGTPAVHKMTQEPITPHELVDCGGAVQAATSAKNHRAKRRFKTQCE